MANENRTHIVHRLQAVSRGIRGPVVRSTLSYANDTRGRGIVADFAQVLIRQARQLYAGEAFAVEIEEAVRALDLCLPTCARCSATTASKIAGCPGVAFLFRLQLPLNSWRHFRPPKGLARMLSAVAAAASEMGIGFLDMAGSAKAQVQ